MDITDLDVCRAFLLPPAGGETPLDLVMFSTGATEDAAREAIRLAHDHGYVNCGEGISRGKVTPFGYALIRESEGFDPKEYWATLRKHEQEAREAAGETEPANMWKAPEEGGEV